MSSSFALKAHGYVFLFFFFFSNIFFLILFFVFFIFLLYFFIFIFTNFILSFSLCNCHFHFPLRSFLPISSTLLLLLSLYFFRFVPSPHFFYPFLLLHPCCILFLNFRI